MEFLDNIGEEPERESNPLIISPSEQKLSFSLLSRASVAWFLADVAAVNNRSIASLVAYGRAYSQALSPLEAAGLSYKLVVGLKLETVKMGQA